MQHVCGCVIAGHAQVVAAYWHDSVLVHVLVVHVSPICRVLCMYICLGGCVHSCVCTHMRYIGTCFTCASFVLGIATPA